MFIKGVESDGSDFIGDLCTSFQGSVDDQDQPSRPVDSVTLEKNKQLKIDCFNNLSGSHF